MSGHIAANSTTEEKPSDKYGIDDAVYAKDHGALKIKLIIDQVLGERQYKVRNGLLSQAAFKMSGYVATDSSTKEKPLSKYGKDVVYSKAHGEGKTKLLIDQILGNGRYKVWEGSPSVFRNHPSRSHHFSECTKRWYQSIFYRTPTRFDEHTDDQLEMHSLPIIYRHFFILFLALHGGCLLLSLIWYGCVVGRSYPSTRYHLGHLCMAPFDGTHNTSPSVLVLRVS